MIALSRNERDELNALRIEVRELREEIAEYRRRRGADEDDSAYLGRLYVWHSAFARVKRSRQAPLKLLMFLMARPGRIIRKSTFLEYLGSDAETKIVDVHICQLRAGLRELGLGEPIETVWGNGVRLSPAAHERLLAFEQRLAEVFSPPLRAIA